MGTESKHGKMAQNIMEIGLIIQWRVKVIISLLTIVSMKEIGSIISSMDMVNKPGLMADAMRDNS